MGPPGKDARPGATPADSKTTPTQGQDSTPAPRRLILLPDGETSAVKEVLAEYAGAEAGRALHEDLQRLASEHRGQCVAAEWQRGSCWIRFLWCRKA